MSKEEISALPEEELYDVAYARIENIVDKYDEIADAVQALNISQKVIYTASYYEMEVNNGGLCQFFVNSSRYLAPKLSLALETIGALEHKEAYDNFVIENGIDLNDLSSFVIYDTSEFEKQSERYPFDDFDEAFYDMKPITDYLTEYVKENIEKF